MRGPRFGLISAVVLAVAGCGTPRPEGAVPPVAPSAGPLTVRVVYPKLTPDSMGTLVGAFSAGDSAFVFGSVSRRGASVSVNDVPATVAATGAWLAWVPLPADSIATLEVLARVDSAESAVTFTARLPVRYTPSGRVAWIDSTSLAPIGRFWTRPDEGLRVSVRAVPGASVRLRLTDSVAIPLLPDTGVVRPSWGELAFGTVAHAPRRESAQRYVGWLATPVGRDPGPVMAPDGRTTGDSAAADSTALPFPLVEAALEGDTARFPWPIRVAVLAARDRPVVIVNDDTAGTGTTDELLAGRPAPYGTYHWFFPNGTRAVVSGRRNDQVRLQLSRGSVAWVDAADVQALPAGTPPPIGTSDAMRLRAGPTSVVLRIPLPGRVPFRLDEDGSRLTLTAYGVAANADWIQYGPEDPLVQRVGFEAPAEDELRVTVDLAEPVWGYRTRWSGDNLLLEIRRPPHIDPRHPLAGIRIALDPGHPPAGATGPTGTYEGDVVLAVARAAVPLFERAGAEVILLRTDTAALALAARPRAAEAADADLLISIHANALPDGVNPFVNSGTSVYYYHPRAVKFARLVDRALVRQFGFRDLGIGRGDLALARPTWMPAILTEGLFMMLPDQEAVLISPEGQRRYAQGLVEGTAAFLTTRAGGR